MPEIEREKESVYQKGIRKDMKFDNWIDQSVSERDFHLLLVKLKQ